MDSTLNDFLNEINEIAPLKTEDKECEWKECFDAKSRFCYYWNTKTDEVTWDKPLDFVPSKQFEPDCSAKAAPSNPLNFPEPEDEVKEPLKIYKLAPHSSTIPTERSRKRSKLVPKKTAEKKMKNQSDSDEEKIVLISSYGSESESEVEEDNNVSSSESPRITNRTQSQSDEEETDILSTVRKRAEELKMLGRAEIQNIPNKIEEALSVSKSSKVSVPSFSLVAGYESNSEEEIETVTPVPKSIIQTDIEEKTYSHSTLFPIVEQPDVNDFIDKIEIAVEDPKIVVPENSFDTKNFQRKRRLGISVVPTQRNNVNQPSPNHLDEERKGLGFSNNNTTSNGTASNFSSNYSNFAKGGMEFVTHEISKEDDVKEDKINIAMEEIDTIYEILHEKLAFLTEGNKDVIPVQIILIQIETLFGALKANSLEPSYLYEWLEGTSEDLIKLEKEAAPEGWLLQWDRSQKRYYYQNQSSGEGQWEYPQADVVRREEAMDISTTPPPPEVEMPVEEVQPPLPPSPPSRSPSPPPPPIISRPEPDPVPEPPSAPKITSFDTGEQPPPPGVDYSESAEYKPKVVQENNDINSAFDSFYSELAAIENTPCVPSPSGIVEQTHNIDSIPEPTLAEPPKKKKKKIKMGQGLSLKKKDVSKLVEKWKKVQKNY